MPNAQQLRLPDGRLVVPREIEELLGVRKLLKNALQDRFVAERKAGNMGRLKPSVIAFATALELTDMLPDAAGSASGTSEATPSRLETTGQVTQLISVKRAAGLVGCSPSYLRRQLRRGRLRGTQEGRDWLISESDFDAWRHGNEGSPSG